MSDNEMRPIAVLRREIGENTWFDWYPVAPGSKTHQALKDDAGMDYCEVYTRPAITDEQVREIAAAVRSWRETDDTDHTLESAIREAIGRGERG